MDAFADFLSRNHWFIVITGLCSAIGIPLAIFYYFKSLRVRKPRYAVRTTALISASKARISALKITFDGYDQPITNLSVTNLAFFNDGKETIRREDIASPLTLYIEDDVILDAALIQHTTEDNEFDITSNNTSATITFRYVDFDEGALFQILHTGKSEDITLDGKIMGAGTPYPYVSSRSSEQCCRSFD